MALVQDDLQERWWQLESKMLQRFGKKPDLDAILFLIGIQETGFIQKKITKEQKEDLMHVAVCTVLTAGDFYQFDHFDADHWPHFKQTKELPKMGLKEQEDFLKDYILFYFQKTGF